MTFDEARKTEKKFKYKDWVNYRDLVGVMETFHKSFLISEINQKLDEKAWEVQEE